MRPNSDERPVDAVHIPALPATGLFLWVKASYSESLDPPCGTWEWTQVGRTGRYLVRACGQILPKPQRLVVTA